MKRPSEQVVIEVASDLVRAMRPVLDAQAKAGAKVTALLVVASDDGVFVTTSLPKQTEDNFSALLRIAADRVDRVSPDEVESVVCDCPRCVAKRRAALQ